MLNAEDEVADLIGISFLVVVVVVVVVVVLFVCLLVCFIFQNRPLQSITGPTPLLGCKVITSTGCR